MSRSLKKISKKILTALKAKDDEGVTRDEMSEALKEGDVQNAFNVAAKKQVTPQILLIVFSGTDANGDGKVTAEELYATYEKLVNIEKTLKIDDKNPVDKTTFQKACVDLEFLLFNDNMPEGDKNALYAKVGDKPITQEVVNQVLAEIVDHHAKKAAKQADDQAKGEKPAGGEEEGKKE